MTVGPQAKFKAKLGRVLFPTNFGEYSKDIFKRVVALAKTFGSRITLYHAIPRPVEPLYHSGVYMFGTTPWIPVQNYYDRERVHHQHHVDAWVEWANNQGVDTDAVIHTDTINVADAILELARERDVDWIAMAAYNGPWAAALLGSVTRKVVRSAECPVWVIHPTKERLSEAA
jgi:nucleotide-binding universal stress UspA family protein